MNFLVRTIAIAQNAILPSHWKPKKITKEHYVFFMILQCCFVLFLSLFCSKSKSCATSSTRYPQILQQFPVLKLSCDFFYTFLVFDITPLRNCRFSSTNSTQDKLFVSSFSGWWLAVSLVTSKYYWSCSTQSLETNIRFPAFRISY